MVIFGRFGNIPEVPDPSKSEGFGGNLYVCTDDAIFRFLTWLCFRFQAAPLTQQLEPRGCASGWRAWQHGSVAALSV